LILRTRCSAARPRLEHPIDLTMSPVGDESRTSRQHTIRAQGRVFPAFAADALRKTAVATVYRASKNIVFFLSLDPPQPALAYRIPVSISVQSAFLDTR
jgi:hypothetical protein